MSFALRMGQLLSDVLRAPPPESAIFAASSGERRAQGPIRASRSRQLGQNTNMQLVPQKPDPLDAFWLCAKTRLLQRSKPRLRIRGILTK
jgi:hypothetical protein